MKLLAPRRRAPSINLSALVDVLFILIVFVMLAADFDRTGAIEVELPGASDPGALPRAAARLVVPASGAPELDGRVIGDGELAGALREARATRADLIIVADGAVPLERATSLIEAGRAAGFDSVTVAARREAP